MAVLLAAGGIMATVVAGMDLGRWFLVAAWFTLLPSGGLLVWATRGMWR